MRSNLKDDNPHFNMKKSLAIICLCICLFVQPIHAADLCNCPGNANPTLLGWEDATPEFLNSLPQEMKEYLGIEVKSDNPVVPFVPIVPVVPNQADIVPLEQQVDAVPLAEQTNAALITEQTDAFPIALNLDILDQESVEDDETQNMELDAGNANPSAQLNDFDRRLLATRNAIYDKEGRDSDSFMQLDILIDDFWNLKQTILKQEDPDYADLLAQMDAFDKRLTPLEQRYIG